VVFLISFSPITAIGNHFISGNRFKNINYLQQADAVCRAATNVESLSTDGVNVLPRCNECVYQIFHKENIADLFSVAKNGKLFLLYGIDREMGDPTLIFVATLMRTVNTTHPKYSRFNSKCPGMIDDVLICGAFRATIRTMKIQRQ